MYGKLALIILSTTLVAGAAAGRDVTDPFDDYRAPGEGSRGFNFDESQVEEWREQVVEVPALSESGLRPVQIDHGPPGGMRFFVDLDTLSVNAKDDIVRYWLVTESGGRRTNVLYEGINCSDRKYKTYAYASPRSTSLVRHVKSPRWEDVGGRSARDFHYELVEDYFCARGSPLSLNVIHTVVHGGINTSSDAFQDAD
jgi:hypothetical protein